MQKCLVVSQSNLPDNVGVLVISAVWIAPSTIHHTCINICWAKRVGLVEQRNYWEKNCSDVLCWIPSFAGQLAALRIVDRRMQNRNAQVSVLVDVRMPDFCDESNGWRWIWIIVWKLHERLKKKQTAKLLGTMRQTTSFRLFLYRFFITSTFSVLEKKSLSFLNKLFGSHCKCEVTLKLRNRFVHTKNKEAFLIRPSRA